MWWSCLPKFKECAWTTCVLHPCGPVTLPGVPWGFSSDKLLQVQSPKKIFCHSNIPPWRQRKRAVSTAILLLSTVY